jgi:Zn-dependent alcohol dehydrogenase
MILKKRKILAAVLTNTNKPLKILTINLPKKLLKNQVLVKNIYSGVCGTQFLEFKGKKGQDKYIPHLMGHESVGIVEQKHKSVTKVKLGDKVLLHWIKSKGIDSENPKYIKNNKIINSGLVSTFSNYSIVSENRLTSINNIKLKNEVLPLLGCSLSTAYASVINFSKITKNSYVVISGGGALGLNLFQIVQTYKPKKIIIIDINKEKINFLKKFGSFSGLIYSSKKILLKKILNITKNNSGIDYFFECSGDPVYAETGFKVLNNKGRLILIGNPDLNSTARFNIFDFIKGKKIIGSYGGDFNPDTDIHKFYKIIKKNNINLNRQIQNVIRLDEINLIFKKMSKGLLLGKTLIKFYHNEK